MRVSSNGRALAFQAKDRSSILRTRFLTPWSSGLGAGLQNPIREFNSLRCLYVVVRLVRSREPGHKLLGGSIPYDGSMPG